MMADILAFVFVTPWANPVRDQRLDIFDVPFPVVGIVAVDMPVAGVEAIDVVDRPDWLSTAVQIPAASPVAVFVAVRIVTHTSRYGRLNKNKRGTGDLGPGDFGRADMRTVVFGDESPVEVHCEALLRT